MSERKLPPASISGSWLRVADEHELGAGGLDVVDELGELAGADHPGLVDDEDGSRGEELAWTVAEVGEQGVDAGGVDPGAVAQLERGAAGERRADHLVAFGLPCLARGVERVGLAGAGLADDDRDLVAVA